MVQSRTDACGCSTRASQPKQSSAPSLGAWWPCTLPGWTLGWQRDRDHTASEERAVGCSGMGHGTWTDLSLGSREGRAAQLPLQLSLSC